MERGTWLGILLTFIFSTNQYVQADPPDSKPSGTKSVTTVTLIPESFKVSQKGFFIPPAQENLPYGQRLNHCLDHAITPIAHLFQVFYSEFNALRPTMPSRESKLPPEFLDFMERYPELVQNHFRATLARFPHAIFFRGNLSRYEITGGARFWIEFLNHPNPLVEVAARAFASHPLRAEFGDYRLRVVLSILASDDASTQIIDTRRLSTDDILAIQDLARNRGLSAARFDDAILLGKGPSFHMTSDVFRNAQKLTTKKQRVSFEIATRTLSQTHTKIKNIHHENAWGFYTDEANVLSLVRPFPSNVGTFVHEAYHTLFFKRFMPPLDYWTLRNGFAKPFANTGTSGQMLLLITEIPSWEVGSLIESPIGRAISQKKIMDVLANGYRSQGGEEAYAVFPRLWDPATAEGLNTFQRMRKHIQRVNQLDLNGHLKLGQRALEGGKYEDAIDFIRLTEARYASRWNEIPEDLYTVLEGLHHKSEMDVVVRSHAGQIAALRRNGKPDPAMTQAFESYKSMAEITVRFLRSQGVHAFPETISKNFLGFFFAVKHNLLDYDALILEMRKTFGDHYARALGDFREGFQAILAEPGTTFEERLSTHVEKFSRRTLPEIWSSFLAKPNPADSVYLALQDPGEFTLEMRLDLIRIASRVADGDVSQAMIATQVLTDLMQAEGLHVQLNPRDIKQLNAAFEADGLSRRFQNRTEPVPSWTNEAVDRALVEAIYKQPLRAQGRHNSELIQLAYQRFSPDELPLLFEETVNQIIRGKGRLFPIALEFIASPELTIPLNPKAGTVMAGVHLRSMWGLSLITGVLQMTNQIHPLVGVTFTDYFRTSVIHNLPGPKWGEPGTVTLDGTIRTQFAEAFKTMSPAEQRLFNWSRGLLFQVLTSKANIVLKRAALYALSSYPGYLIQSEPELLKNLNDPNSRDLFVELISHTRPGLLPEVDRVLAEGKIAFTESQSALLRLREPFDLTTPMPKCFGKLDSGLSQLGKSKSRKIHVRRAAARH